MVNKYEAFKDRWLDKIENSNLSSTIKGRKFAKKILKEWLGHDYNDNSKIIDGFGDRVGGIDSVYFQSMDEDEENGPEGDAWYLIQSQYGKAFENANAILTEGRNLIYAIEGKKMDLPSLPNIDRLQTFKNFASEKDKIILLLATIDPLTEEQEDSFKDVMRIGTDRLGQIFDVKSINLRTLFNRHNEEEEEKKVIVPFFADLEKSGEELLIGSVKLQDLYKFLKAYEHQRGEFDLIYKKNVRMFLGGGKKVNQGIAQTINECPERFGLYNNGITIVVEDFKKSGSVKGKYDLTQPFVVNGCQTTKIIYRELKKKLENQSLYSNVEHEKYLAKLSKGILVVKIVKAMDDEDGKELLKSTTKFTNSQNTVSLKDFIALDDKFQIWAREMEKEYGIFLEIQRGEYLFKKNYLNHDNWVNAFDLIKIYGAGWLEEPGTAFGKNHPFAPKGRIFNKITELKYFDIQDLHACYLLFKLTKTHHFGERGYAYQRGKTGYLFCYILIQLTKEILRQGGLGVLPKDISNSVNFLLTNDKTEDARNVYNPALDIIDDYMTLDKPYSIYKDKNWIGDANAYLKSEKIGKSDYSPNLCKLIDLQKGIIANDLKSDNSKFQKIVEALKGNRHTNKPNKNSNESVAGTKPYKLVIEDVNYNVNSWTTVFLHIVNYIAISHPEIFASYASANVKLISRDKSKFRDPKELKNKFYIETNYNAPTIFKNCTEVMALANVKWSVDYN